MEVMRTRTNGTAALRPLSLSRGGPIGWRHNRGAKIEAGGLALLRRISVRIRVSSFSFS